MRVRKETSSSAWVQPWDWIEVASGVGDSVIDERRSVSRKMKPRSVDSLALVACLYSSMLCWAPRGLFSLCQDRVLRWVSGKRWMWESTIGYFPAELILCLFLVTVLKFFFLSRVVL